MLVRRPASTGGRHWPAVVLAALAASTAVGQSGQVGLQVRPATGAGDLQADRPIVLDIERPGASPDAPVPRVWIEESFAGATAGDAPSCEARAARLGGAPSLSPPVRDFNAIAVALVTPGGLHVLDPRGGLRGARSLAFAEFGGTATAWSWGGRSGMFHAVLGKQREIVTVDPGAWRVTARYAVAGTPIAVMEDGTGSAVVLARREGVDEVSWPHDPSRRPVAVPAGSDRLVPIHDGGVAAVGPGKFHIIEGGSARSLETRLDAQVYPVVARTIFGLDSAGTLKFLDPASGVSGIVAGMEGADASRLWTTPDGRLLVVWKPEGNEAHIVDVARRVRVHSLTIERPRSFAASASFLFVRSAAHGELLVIPRAGLLEGNPAAPRRIAAGEMPGTGRQLPITASDEGTAAWVDHERTQVYVYHEGMNIPSATLRMPAQDALDIALVGPLVRPAGPGRYTATATIDEPGEYVAVATAGGAVTPVCQSFVLGGKARANRTAERFAVTLIDPPSAVTLGRPAPFRFRISAADGGTLPDMASVGMLLMEIGGTHQQRWRATRQSDGTFSAEFTPWRPGEFMVMPDQATLPGRIVGRPVATIVVGPAP